MTKEQKENAGWGGKREGAGRPSAGNVSTISLRIPADVAEILGEQENRTAYIIEAIRAYDRQQRTRTILGLEISVTKNRK